MGTLDHHAIDEIEDAADATFAQLCALIEDNGVQEASLGEAWHGRRGADVVAHLHGWHLLFVDWAEAHFAGDAVILPAPGHTWSDLAALNDEIYARYAATPYAQIRPAAVESRRAMFAQLRRFPGHTVTTAGAVDWYPEPLLELADECAARHDEWALARVRAALVGA